MPLLALTGLKVLNFLLVGTSESQDASSAISLFSSLPLLVSSLSLFHYTLLSIFSGVPPITLSFSGIDPPILLYLSHLDIPSCDYTIHFFSFPHLLKEGICLFSGAYGSQSSLVPVIYLHRVVLPPMTSVTAHTLFISSSYCVLYETICCHSSGPFSALAINFLLCSLFLSLLPILLLSYLLIKPLPIQQHSQFHHFLFFFLPSPPLLPFLLHQDPECTPAICR